jgi:tetratricopeptide (TPR) repeat protein
MAELTDFSLVNLILKNLEKTKQFLKEGHLLRALHALLGALELRISHEFRPENQELIDRKLYRISSDVTGSREFKSRFGPVSVALGDNKTFYDFLKSMISAAMEISGVERLEMLKKAQQLLDSGKIDEARDLLNSLLAATPDDVSLYLTIGERYLSNELYEDAELTFRQAQCKDRNSIHIINRLGIAFRKMGRYDDAIAEYAKAIKIAPSDAHLYYNLAVALYSKKDYPRALMIVEKSLRLKPDFAEGLELKEAVTMHLSNS